MRLDPLILVALSVCDDGDDIEGEVLVRVDRIESIATAECGGSQIGTTSGVGLHVAETPDEVRLKLVAAMELASEALS